MANAKRASMREGPLAALFRKTEGAEEETPEHGRSERPAETPAAQARRTAEDAAAPREPRPGLGAEQQRQAEAASDEPARVPTPRERLRQAFSSEIPENMLDRPRHAARTPDGHPREREAAAAGRGRDGQPVIRVVGVGGAGVNAVSRMVEAEVEGVEFVTINTDMQSLEQSSAHVTLHIGAELTRGLGSGSDPSVGRQAAMEDYDSIKALLKGSDMSFITARARGGTGSGAAPIVARIAREVGALTVAIVTKPFGFEGTRRGEQAEEGVEALAGEVDTLIVGPNNRLLSVLDKQTAIVEAFRVADDVLRQGVQGISDLVTLPGLINLDFAAVRTIM